MQTINKSVDAASGQQSKLTCIVAGRPNDNTRLEDILKATNTTTTVNLPHAPPGFASRWELPDNLATRAPEIFRKLTPAWMVSAELLFLGCQRLQSLHAALMTDPWPEDDPEHVPKGYDLYFLEKKQDDSSGEDEGNASVNANSEIQNSTDNEVNNSANNQINSRANTQINNTTTNEAEHEAVPKPHTSPNTAYPNTQLRLHRRVDNAHHDGPQASEFNQRVWDALSARIEHTADTVVNSALPRHTNSRRDIYISLDSFLGTEEEWDVVCDFQLAFEAKNADVDRELQRTANKLQGAPDLDKVRAERVAKGLRV